jgi:hypothetical protein
MIKKNPSRCHLNDVGRCGHTHRHNLVTAKKANWYLARWPLKEAIKRAGL